MKVYQINYDLRKQRNYDELYKRSNLIRIGVVL